MNDILKEFLVESNEGLDQLEQDFLALEQDPGNSERLKSVFRIVHTIKGTSGFLALPVLESVAHVGEGVLSRLRDGEIRFDQGVADVLLRLGDTLRRILRSLESHGVEGDEDHSPLLRALEQHLASGPGAPVEAAVPDAAQAPIVARREDAAEQAPAGGVSENSIRVDVSLLDKLMTLVGELVLARNQVLQHSGLSGDETLHATSQRLNLITTELQESVMKTRMQPIGNVWAKLPRVVRDLAHACGKEVRLELEGKDTELDKTLIEAIKDPLVHIVRNSIDHGIERPEIRQASGKPREGVLRLCAYHEGGQVNVDIIDDGHGIDPVRIKAVAVARGVITEAQAARLSERDAVNLIFEPGFSTAAKVTNVSGRGVGMDVVRTNIERIGGTIDLQSTVGQGTVLKLKIPLTLAIIPALVAESRGERFAIPQVSLLELVRLDAQQAGTAIEMIHGAPVYRLRGRLLPLVYLHQALGMRAHTTADGQSQIIVVLRLDDRQFGLVVDAVHDTEEIVVKPLGRHLKGLDAFAGATIMGDGTVALIVDVHGVARSAGLLATSRDRAPTADVVVEDATGATDDRQTLLIMALGDRGRAALPLSTVARLEQFEAHQVEFSGSRPVVQYRGQILPLIDVPAWLGNTSAMQGEQLHAVVYTAGGRSVGLVVDRILDIVNERITVRDDSAPRHGLAGSIVVQDRVTDLLDLDALAEHAGLEGAAHVAQDDRDGTTETLTDLFDLDALTVHADHNELAEAV